MPTERSHTRYLLSMAEELLSQSDRVRNLIGDVHWSSDGSHKEMLLRDVLSRHLPSGTLAARGFVLDTCDNSRPSKEIDILVLDTRTDGPLFHQGGLVMGYPQQVLAAISVKSTLGSTALVDAWANLQSVRRLSLSANHLHGLWCGAFFFEVDDAIKQAPGRIYDRVRIAAQKAALPRAPLEPTHAYRRGPDMIATARDYVCLLDYSNQDSVEARTLRCNGIATATFLGNIFNHIAKVRGADSSALASHIDGSESTPIEPFPTTIQAPSSA